MVQVRGINGYAEQSGHGKHADTLEETRELLFLYGCNKETYRHERYHKQEVVSHLQVVRENLPRHEERRQHPAPQVFSAVAENHSGQGWRYEGKRKQFPDVPGSYYNKEV